MIGTPIVTGRHFHVVVLPVVLQSDTSRLLQLLLLFHLDLKELSASGCTQNAHPAHGESQRHTPAPRWKTTNPGTPDACQRMSGLTRGENRIAMRQKVITVQFVFFEMTGDWSLDEEGPSPKKYFKPAFRNIT